MISTMDDEGQLLWRAMERIFGLPPGVSAFELRMGVDEIVTIKIEYAPELKDRVALAELARGRPRPINPNPGETG